MGINNEVILNLFKGKLSNYAQNDKQNSKVPFRGFRGETKRKAAKRNPVEGLRNE